MYFYNLQNKFVIGIYLNHRKFSQSVFQYPFNAYNFVKCYYHDVTVIIKK